MEPLNSSDVRHESDGSFGTKTVDVNRALEVIRSQGAPDTLLQLLRDETQGMSLVDTMTCIQQFYRELGKFERGR